MTGIGVLVPDDGLEDYIRQVGHLPERTSDTRELDDARQTQQEQSPKDNEICKNRHCYPSIVTVYDNIGIKLPGASGT